MAERRNTLNVERLNSIIKMRLQGYSYAEVSRILEVSEDLPRYYIRELLAGSYDWILVEHNEQYSRVKILLKLTMQSNVDLTSNEYKQLVNFINYEKALNDESLLNF